MNNIYSDDAVLKILPEKLRNFRKRNGLTIYEVATKVGKVASSISLWEKGKALPDVRTLLKLCKIYGLESIEELLASEELDKNTLTKSEIEILKLWRGADKKTKDAVKLLLQASNKEI